MAHKKGSIKIKILVESLNLTLCQVNFEEKSQNWNVTLVFVTASQIDFQWIPWLNDKFVQKSLSTILGCFCTEKYIKKLSIPSLRARKKRSLCVTEKCNFLKNYFG